MTSEAFASFDLAEFRVSSDRLNDHLSRFEWGPEDHRGIEDLQECAGALIEHVGGWARLVGARRAGLHHCSFGRFCQGQHRRHSVALGCDVALLQNCPLCGQFSGALCAALGGLFAQGPPAQSHVGAARPSDGEVFDRFAAAMKFDLVEYRVLDAGLDCHLSSLECEPLDYDRDSWTFEREACPGMLVLHEGTWSRYLSAADNFVPHCSQGSRCNGSRLWHPAGGLRCNHSLLGACDLCESAAARRVAAEVRGIVEAANASIDFDL